MLQSRPSLLACSCAFVALVTASADASITVNTSVNTWNHGWATASDMTFADFNSDTLLTDAQASDVVAKFRIISLEKCTGVRSGVTTEEAIYATALQLKAKQPKAKVLFYLATDQQGIQCYAANDAFASHPEWHMRLDNGSAVVQNGHAILDPTVPAAAAWWASIPLGGINGTGMYKGVKVSTLIDGVLADSGGYSNVGGATDVGTPGISTARKEQISDAKRVMMGSLQKMLTAANGGVLMANGVSMYGGANADPRYVNSSTKHHNLVALEEVNAIMNEHTAVFECVNRNNNSFNADTVATDLQVLVDAAHLDGGSKTVFVQTWPGLYTATAFTPRGKAPAHVYPSYPGCDDCEPTPQSNDEWRDALRRHFAFAQALFLSIAEANMYWMYGGYWYDSKTGYIACPEDPASCASPAEWFPDLKKPLGAPLGPRKLVGPYVWTREFEHASVRLDLLKRNTSAVTYHDTR